MATSVKNLQSPTPETPHRPERFLLWVDGVGAFLLFTGSRVTVGGPTGESGSADLVLLANLARRHVTFVRSGESYVLEAHAPCRLDGRSVESRAALHPGAAIELASGVRLTFRIPSVLSNTAVVEFASDHRPSRSIDGVILMDETCLLGPTRDNHVVGPNASESVLLYRKPDGFWCKGRSPLAIDGRPAVLGGPLGYCASVSGEEFGFRVEPA